MAPNLENTSTHLSLCLRVHVLHHSSIQQFSESWLCPRLCEKPWKYSFGPWENVVKWARADEVWCPVQWGVERILALLLVPIAMFRLLFIHPHGETFLLWDYLHLASKADKVLDRKCPCGWTSKDGQLTKMRMRLKEGHERQSKEQVKCRFRILGCWVQLSVSLSFQWDYPPGSKKCTIVHPREEYLLFSAFSIDFAQFSLLVRSPVSRKFCPWRQWRKKSMNCKSPFSIETGLTWERYKDICLCAN